MNFKVLGAVAAALTVGGALTIAGTAEQCADKIRITSQVDEDLFEAAQRPRPLEQSEAEVGRDEVFVAVRFDGMSGFIQQMRIVRIGPRKRCEVNLSPHWAC